MSTQETKLQAIADAIREKDGTTDPIPANDFPDRIRAIEGKSEFAVPLVVALDEGAIVTATKGDRIITAVANSDRRAVLTLDQSGNWSVEARLGDLERGPEKLEVLNGYELSFSFQKSRLPDGYTEVEYISNPNLGVIQPVIENIRPFMDTRLEIQVELVDRTANCALFGNYYYYRYASTLRSNAHMLRYYSNDQMLDLEIGYQSSGGYPKWRIPILAPEDKMQIIVDFPKRLYAINDTEAAIDASATLSTQYLNGVYPALFGTYESFYNQLSASGSSTSYIRPQLPANCKLYKFKLYESTAADTGDLIMDLVPCINPDGEIGVYNMVNDVFLTHSTVSPYDTRPFEAGPAV